MSDQVVSKSQEKLTAPRRNNYYYGKLLTEEHLRMEQEYFNYKRWLLNALSLNAGVLVGLKVTEKDGELCIRPGVALDAWGREIIIPREICFDPWKMTDDRGRKTGDSLDREQEHNVSICLVYKECLTDYEPVWKSDCNTEEDEVASTILESLCIVVQKVSHRGWVQAFEADDTLTRELDDLSLDDLTEEILSGPGILRRTPSHRPQDLCAVLTREVANRRAALTDLLGVDYAPASGPPCVPVAIAKLGQDGTIEDIRDTRRLIYSNSVLLEMILCLADRVEECCQLQLPIIKTLRIVSGNNQTSQPGAQLPEPVVAQVVNAVDDTPIVGEEVGFEASSIGSVAPEMVNSDDNGLVAARWALGPSAGVQMLTASIVSGAQVVFQATAEGNGTGDPQVIKDLRIVSGNNQTAQVDTPLAEPVVVQVVNAINDSPVSGETVSFQLHSDGLVVPVSIASDSDGLAVANWTLGSSSGMQILTASIGTGEKVDFRATATGSDAGDADSPPVIMAFWPPNARELSSEEWLNGMEQPRLEITFDRQMNGTELEDPQGWLRVWRLLNWGTDEISITRIHPQYVGNTENPVLQIEGVTATYEFSNTILDLPEGGVERVIRFLVQIRGDNIIEAGTQGLVLDADFAGTALSISILDQLWNGTVHGGNRKSVFWDGLVDTGVTLPRSGDGHEGGHFHSWFEVTTQ